jgi:hypothetical protein
MNPPSAEHSPAWARRHLPAMLLGLLFALLPFRLLHANDYGPLGLGEMIANSHLVVIANLKPSAGKLDVKVVEVLKGIQPPEFVIPTTTYSYQTLGREIPCAVFGGVAEIKLDDLPASSRWILFFQTDHKGGLRTFHPACVQPEAKKVRVLEILAMNQDPGPFIAAPQYAGDLDLIYTLGVRFTACHLSAPAVLSLETINGSTDFDSQEMPWQHTRFTCHFTFQPTRKPMLQMAPFEAQGALPDFIRSIDALQGFEKFAREAKDPLPPEFDVTLDTTGPKNIGGATFAAAADFLRTQLRSDNVNVIAAAYLALTKLMDLDAVSIAIGMLGHPDNKFRSHAAKFLSYAKDPRSIEALVTALDELPPCIRYGSKDYNPEVQQLSIALGSALRNLRDVRTVPALKRAIRKGYSDWLALTLSRLGDESAVEPLLFQLRNADLYYDASYLVTMIERSNLHVEPWMKESPRSDDDAGRHRMGNQWLEWWEAHQADFRIVRSWEEVRDKARP